MTREWDASSYHRLSDPQFNWGRRVLARLSLRGDETVIDAGCGTARLTVELAALLPRGRVLAVDLSENMLHQARQTITAAKTEKTGSVISSEDAAVNERPGVGREDAASESRNLHLSAKAAPTHLVCADLAALPFKEIADGIFSTAAFHWVGDHDALFRSLFTALKPGGWLVAQCGGGPNLLRLRQRTEVAMQLPEFSEYFRGWTPPQVYYDDRETAVRLRHAGFSDVATWLGSEDVRFPDSAVYREFLATVTLHAHLNRIPAPALRDRFLDRIIALAQQEPSLHLDYWRLNLHARKPY
jgi:trans-aconitate 2-methyltransferase